MDSEQWGIIIQTLSVIIAMVASIASWRVATLTAKQYELNKETMENKTKPILIINHIQRESFGLILWIGNVGFPSYYIKEVNSSNDKIRIDSHFKGEKDSKEGREDRFFIRIHFAKDITEKTVISLEGIDINGNEFCLKPPEFIIENGKLKNGDQIHKQYLMDEKNES